MTAAATVPSMNALFLDELRMAEETRVLFSALGTPMEFWEALCLAQADAMMIRNELDHLEELRRSGRPAAVGALHARILQELRGSMGRSAQEIRGFIDHRLKLPLERSRIDLLVAVILISADSRREMNRWLAWPDKHRREAVAGLMQLAEETAGYHREIHAGPAPTSEAPALAAGAKEGRPSRDVDAEVLEALRFVDRFREIFDRTHQKIEFWEVLCLRMEDESAARLTVDELLLLKDGGDTVEFNERAIGLFERLLEIRAKHRTAARAMREYLKRLPMGSYGPETLELALGFIMASVEGRRRAAQWLEMPDQYLREAAIRVEGVIGRAQHYQRELRAPAAV